MIQVQMLKLAAREGLGSPSPRTRLLDNRLTAVMHSVDVCQGENYARTSPDRRGNHGALRDLSPELSGPACWLHGVHIWLSSAKFPLVTGCGGQWDQSLTNSEIKTSLSHVPALWNFVTICLLLVFCLNKRQRPEEIKKFVLGDADKARAPFALQCLSG